MEFISKLKKKVLHGQSREIVSNLLSFMKMEARRALEENPPIIPLSQVHERVAAATGVSLRTIQRVASERKKVATGEKTCFETPSKTRDKKTQRRLNDADLPILRRVIVNFHLMEKKQPTLKGIQRVLADAIEYNGSISSLRKDIRKIGFRWRKTRTNRKLLMEKSDIRQLRLNFLRSMKAYRLENRPIIYMDETYIHANQTKLKNWNDETNDGFKQNINKGQRLIMIHAGGAEGFVPGAFTSWKSNCSTGDYHNEMNFENYKKWMQEKLIPNLPPRSVLVIDNAPYHNKQLDKCPTSATRKQDMQDWLRSKNIPFEEPLSTLMYIEVLYALNHRACSYRKNCMKYTTICKLCKD